MTRVCGMAIAPRKQQRFMPPLPTPPNPDLLGSWTHSHEEDRNDRKVFRHTEYPFPPSRGRLGFELLPDGAARFSGLAADDRHDLTPCRWSLDPQHPEDLTISKGEQCLLRASIAAVDSLRLELKFHES